MASTRLFVVLSVTGFLTSCAALKTCDDGWYETRQVSQYVCDRETYVDSSGNAQSRQTNCRTEYATKDVWVCPDDAGRTASPREEAPSRSECYAGDAAVCRKLANWWWSRKDADREYRRFMWETYYGKACRLEDYEACERLPDNIACQSGWIWACERLSFSEACELGYTTACKRLSCIAGNASDC